MTEQDYTYVIVGGGLAGASAVDGIREVDPHGSVLLIGDERVPPYHRPPLTKGLWLGKKTLDQIFVHPHEAYTDRQIALKLGVSVVSLDPAEKTVRDDAGNAYRYQKLLLATGGRPRHLTIPGGALDGVTYYRYLDDYQAIRQAARPDSTAVVVGGGFIGSELAAALNSNRVIVSMIYPEAHLAARVFPEELGRTLQQRFQARGIGVYAGDMPTAIDNAGEKLVTRTRNGHTLESDMLIVGAGILPDVELAESAGLALENGICVDEFLQTSAQDIYAAGDNANFPYQAVGHRARIEHWDNALSQGKAAGRNMAGAREPFTYMPYFYSDLFEFGYEAVGDVDARLDTYADWTTEHETGVIYYLKDGRVRGVMLCNIYGKLDEARALIACGERYTPDQLRGAITPGKKAA